MEAVLEGKFTQLRRRLDQLGYKHPLGIESLPLVERLFSDLLHTTEALKGIKKELGTRRETSAEWQRDVEPLKGDNAKLTREVNQLHMELIRRKDAADAKAKEAKAILRKVRVVCGREREREVCVCVCVSE
jgi:hypothetical protein